MYHSRFPLRRSLPARERKVSVAAVAPAAPLDERYRKGAWAVVSSEAGADGIVDWAAWEATAKPPLTYDPPQLKPGFMPCDCVDWFSHRSALCGMKVRLSSPLPCCCVMVLEALCLSGLEHNLISDPDDWFVRMLQHPDDSACPPHIRGIWWMRDNLAAPETLITFHDAEWASPRLGLKRQPYNWTHDSTCWGFIFSVGGEACLHQNQPGKATLRLEISPSGKWMHMDMDQMIYVVQEGDSYARPDGSRLAAGDLMRLSWREGWQMNTSEPLFYQYHVQRVAYLDSDRKLVKTAAYDELRANVLAPSTSPCWRMCWSGAQASTALRELSDVQTWRPVPNGKASAVVAEAPASVSQDKRLDAPAHSGAPVSAMMSR